MSGQAPGQRNESLKKVGKDQTVELFLNQSIKFTRGGKAHTSDLPLTITTYHVKFPVLQTSRCQEEGLIGMDHILR